VRGDAFADALDVFSGITSTVHFFQTVSMRYFSSAVWLAWIACLMRAETSFRSLRDHFSILACSTENPNFLCSVFDVLTGEEPSCSFQNAPEIKGRLSL
jgi:hypothetical protein